MQSLELLGPGPLSAEATAALGDLIGITETDAALFEEDDAIQFKGHHGGCLPDEVLVPVFVFCDGDSENDFESRRSALAARKFELFGIQGAQDDDEP